LLISLPTLLLVKPRLVILPNVTQVETARKTRFCLKTRHVRAGETLATLRSARAYILALSRSFR